MTIEEAKSEIPDIDKYLPTTIDSFFNRLGECKNNEVKDGEDKS